MATCSFAAVDNPTSVNGLSITPKTAVVGSGSNTVSITENGVVFNGTTTHWDDLTANAYDRTLPTGQDKLTINFTNITLDLATDITTNSLNNIPQAFQMSHKWDTNSVDVHVHFLQPTTTNANYTNFFAIMRWIPNGKAPEPWYRFAGTPVFTNLTAPNQMQIHDFGCPPIVDAGYSAALDVIVEYDGTKGHDAIIPVKFVDVHYSQRSMGTNNEYD